MGKYVWTATLSAIIMLQTVAQAPPRPDHAVTAMTEQEKTLYAFGLSLAQSANRFNLSSEELEIVVLGLTDGAMRRAKLDVNEYRARVYALGDARLSASAEVERKKGAEFRALALTEPGAIKRESGLVMVPIQPGVGNSPTKDDTVRVQYTGTLRDGTVFDSTRNEPPLKVVLNTAAVPCLIEGIQLMKAGGRSRILCPPELARGMAHPLVTPGSTLVYDLTLVEIVK